jgi:hypothetical protein
VLRELGVPAGCDPVRFPLLVLQYEGTEFTKHRVELPADPEAAEQKIANRARLDKSAGLRGTAALVVAKALPQHGLPRKMRERASHKQLAQMAGYRHRSSFTRNMRNAVKRGFALVRRTKRFAATNLYRWNFPEGQNERFARDCFIFPAPSELSNVPHLEKHFRRAKGNKAYQRTPAWIFDPKTPGNANQKNVLIYLATRGLFQLDGQGHCKGELELAQGEIARGLGLCKSTVFKALRFYSDQTWIEDGVEHHGVGLLRIVEQPGEFDSQGNWHQPPNKIIYLPGRVLDQEQCAAEVDRLLAAGQSLRGSSWWNQILEVHTAALKEWQGTERTLATFWKECRRRMHERGIPGNLIGQLLPRPPS